jgi:hypothetical protein
MRDGPRHERVSPALGEWRPYMTAPAQAMRHGPGVVEGACAQGVVDAKEAWHQQVPISLPPCRPSARARSGAWCRIPGRGGPTRCA